MYGKIVGTMFCEDVVFECAPWVSVVSVLCVGVVWVLWVMDLYVCLGAQEVVVCLYGQDVCFVVQQVYVCGLSATCCSANGIVLNDLDVFNVCMCYGWAPDGCGVVYGCADECFVCVHDCLLRLTPAATCKSLEDVEPRLPLLDQVLGVLAERVVGVERHSEDLRCLAQGQLGAVDGDVWCVV